MDYRDTLYLPKTSFPMKANLPEKEPQRLLEWNEMDLYQMQRKERANRTKFVLHDGPPYANGDIHTGTALNKILKDMINRYWSLAGRDVVYIPGWDTHGLPIEMRALKQLGVSQHQIEPIALRRECARVAAHYIHAMTEEFERLGVLGDWKHPYVTMSPEYEGVQLDVFAAMVDKGLIYRDLRPVYWCPHCETALAEGEIEYHNHLSDAIYVAFPVSDNMGLIPSETRAVVWTTTPWTIPANVAISVHPDLLYEVLETKQDGRVLVAKDLASQLIEFMHWEVCRLFGPWSGKELEGILTQHPYLGHDVPVILGEHVTNDSGTGLVHTAPGHGMEDFEVAKKYHLPVVQPIDDQGRFIKGTPVVEGLFYHEANARVIAELKAAGHLIRQDDFAHQYAYCWRCKNPVIYRATKQWFLSVEHLRANLIQATYPVKWDPNWGGERMRQMVENRGDWCLSRQRVWGVPIPAFYCEDCHEAILDVPLIRHVAEIIAREGADSWWRQDTRYFLPEGYRCPHCHSDKLKKEHDIFDVWLDSGSSQAAVLGGSQDLSWPADLVLEGNDQYRGWFNSLLTTAVAESGEAPYRMVLTHGMVLDKSGQEMHKSLGNTIDPMDIVKQYGADILRLWVASSEYRNDVRISDEILRQLAESYRKIRNTFRFILGNVGTVDTFSQGAVHDPLNRWVVNVLNSWTQEAQQAYENYAFHQVVHTLVRLLTTELSSFYLDVIKDRLYTLDLTDPLRQETLSVLKYMAEVLVRIISPILVFTSEEIYHYLPKSQDALPSVHLLHWPQLWVIDYDHEESLRMSRLLAYREVILKTLEQLRGNKTIGNSLEAMVHLNVSEDDLDFSTDDRELLQEMVMVADLDVHKGRDVVCQAEPTAWSRCDRCWRYTPDVGTHPDHVDLCERCYGVLKGRQ